MSLYDAFIAPLLQNQVVTGLSFTALLGAVGYQARRLPSAALTLVRRALIVRWTVYGDDPAFEWFDRWLAEQSYAARARTTVLRTYRADEDGNGVDWALSPGYGFHWFWWRGHFFWFNRDRTNPGESASGLNRIAVDRLDFSTIARSQVTVRTLLSEAHGAVAGRRAHVAVKLWRGWWSVVPGKRPRPLDTVVLAPGQSDRIVADIERFLASRAWYEARGVPWRRGYLFAGPPGTGKTSFVVALAGHLRRPVCVLNLGSVRGDDDLFSAVSGAPPDAIVLIEDVDCAVAAAPRGEGAPSPVIEGAPLSKKVTALDEKEHVSKAGLLNALDGVTTPDGRIFIMTTNRPEELDPALVRPGRADITEMFGSLDAAGQLRLAALHGLPDFVPLPESVTPARLQGIFMRFGADAGAARAALLCEREELPDVT